MRHTYKLSVVGCNTELLFESGRYAWQAVVDHPQVLEIDEAVFMLQSGEPDLPIGSTVRIELGRGFTAETLEYIEWKRANGGASQD